MLKIKTGDIVIVKRNRYELLVEVSEIVYEDLCTGYCIDSNVKSYLLYEIWFSTKHVKWVEE